ncbi:MAG: hypothetical protein FWF90_05290 [Promicromonosporaceae bacterium]|nr:hypothetical protein [Promicromonosporaceae bacterium]
MATLKVLVVFQGGPYDGQLYPVDRSQLESRLTLEDAASPGSPPAVYTITPATRATAKGPAYVATYDGPVPPADA